MSMSITMLQTRMGEAGSLLVSGNTYTVSDAFGAEMVGKRFASDTNGVLNPQARGNFTAAEYAALISAVAAGTSTYSAAEIERLAGVPQLTGLALLMSQTTYPRGFVLGQVGGYAVTAPASTSWAVTDNGSGKQRWTGAAHGLTAATDGMYCYLSAASGLVAGLYRMTWVSTSIVDFLDLTYTAVGTPTMVARSNPITLMSLSVPAWSMGPNGVVELDLSWTTANNATAKFGRVSFGGTTLDLSLNAQTIAEQRVRIANQQLLGALQSSQRWTSAAVHAASAVAATQTSAVDTSAAVALLVQAQVTAADEYIRLGNGRVTVYPKT